MPARIPAIFQALCLPVFLALCLPAFLALTVGLGMAPAAASAAAARPAAARPTPASPAAVIPGSAGPAVDSPAAAEPDAGPRLVEFAALLPLTGDSAHSGEAARAGAELAVEEVNGYFAAKGVPLRVGLVVMDTQTDPATALEKLQQVARGGFPPIVLGPDSSAEAAALREYANGHGILLVSHASTAPSLAIPGDNIYRLIPNDRLEAEALAMLVRGVEGLPYRADVVVPIYRNDVFGNDLLAAFKEEFTRRGGLLVEPGVAYSPGTQDFTGPVHELSRAVGAALTAHGDARVAVYLIAFEEAADIFRLARRHPPLSWVPWYGSNGTAQSGAFSQDREAAAFASRTNFISPAYVPDVDTLQSLPVQLAQLRARLGREPEPFAQLAREALWLMALAYWRTGMEQPGTEDLRAAFLDLTGEEGNYRGSIGGRKALLDAAGDAMYGNTGFFALEEGPDGYRWIRRAQLYRSPFHEPYWKSGFEPDPFERTAGHGATGGEGRQVTIGALLPLAESGPQPDGRVEDLRVALELARDDINQYLADIGSPYRVVLRIESTLAGPAAAREALARLAADRVSIAIGPTRSSIAEAILEDAKRHGIFLLSPSSTAPGLAIPGDNLYRLVPDDSVQAQAAAALMAVEGVKAAIPLYLGDIYGEGLAAGLRAAFEAVGGTVLEGVRFGPGTEDFSTAVKELGDAVAEAVGRYGRDGVAVYAIAFEEVAGILQAAAAVPVLTEIRWYGTDGHALHPAVVGDESAARVAASVKLTSPVYRINPSDGLQGVFFRDYEVLMARLQQRLGRPATDYAAAAYTAMWWAARALFASGEPGGAGPAGAGRVKEALEAVLMPHEGLPIIFATGDSWFNGAGDQTLGHYLFYRVVEEDGGFRWKEYAVFSNGYNRKGIGYR